MKMLIKNENGYTGEDTERTIKGYYDNLPQKTKEYMEFVDFLLEQEEWDRDVIIITGKEWDEFFSSNDEDREMKLEYCNASEFYDKFAEITGTDKWKFETCFVSAKYIDEICYNTMNLIVKINGINQRFIIDAV